MKYNLLPTILFFFFVCFLQAQEVDKSAIKDSIEKYIYQAANYREEYRFKESLESGNKAIAFAKQINDIYSLAILHNDLGLVYEGFSELSKSRVNYLKSLEYAIKIKNDTLKSWAYNNLGNIYSEGYKNTDSANHYYEKSLRLAEKLKDTPGILTPILNIGWTYADLGEHEKSYAYLIDAEKLIKTKHGDDSAIAQVSFLLGRYYMYAKDYTLADDYFRTSILYAKSEGLLEELTEIYKYYSELAKNQGDKDEAYIRLEQHLKYKDSLYNRNKLEELQNAQIKFEVDEIKKNYEKVEAEKRDQDIILQQSQQISYVLMIAGFILILLLINMFKNYKFRNKALAKLRLKNTELRVAKEEAEQQANLKSQFFSTVSHELRTPLYGVVGLTSLLTEDFPNLKENENFKSLKFSSKYLLSLINNVLQMNKIESKGVKLERIPFNIRNLVSEVVNSFGFAINHSENKVHQEIDPQIPEILLGDSVRLSQILMNLIGNAIKFTESGNIWIQLNLIKEEAAKYTINFTIKDDGLGIPEEKQVAIFDKFVQLRPIEKNYQGTGLGLPIVKRLLELFDSDITLESKENEGAMFQFSIVFEESKELLEQVALTPNDVIDSEKKCILVVDDNKINRVVTKRILKSKGYQCDVAEDGSEAIEKVQNNTYDLILMDINMPKIDGIEATKQIRQQKINIPIIALTAVEEDQIKDKIQEAGMNDLIIKPYDIEEFHQIILKNLYVNLI
ncbi:tetratricopeptide repeat-containing hybrid sensor histidine kinase/response regulator [Kordia jejudonensis]|uniref:tetratricopeptide repeat-containing hybrid sensor histidine kinase/response regulator n=1 Tax=Kordia jejudonensis TaxID=1348245 RepID=UPI0012E06048|nr:response regulator [Kordia jejudonensis]